MNSLERGAGRDTQGAFLGVFFTKVKIALEISL